MHHLIFTVFLFIFLCGPSLAQIYKYMDKDGVVRYTDDLSKVPENQQDEGKKYEEIKNPKTDNTDIKKPIIQKTPADAKTKKASKQPARSKAETKDLANQKQELEKEYIALMNEKKQIAKQMETYSKRYKTRARKSVSRKKLIELEQQKKEWGGKFNDYKAKKKALEMLEKKSGAGKKKAPSTGNQKVKTDSK